MLKDEKLKMTLMQAPNYSVLYTNHMHQPEKKMQGTSVRPAEIQYFLVR